MKIDRLIGIVTLLLQKDRLTAPELAARFEVSRRTINRDIEHLCKAGIPLVTVQGYGGGISIAKGYQIDKSFLTDPELQILLAALKGIGSVSESAYLRALTEKLHGDADRLIADQTIVIDLASHYQAPLTEKIASIKAAITQHRTLTFRYFYEKGEQQKRIEPYRLLFRWANWYLFGYCFERADFRLFKLNRLWQLEVTDERFIPRMVPAQACQSPLDLSSGGIHLKARFEPEAKYRLIEEYGIDCFCTDSDGKLLFEWDYVSYAHMQEWILSFGGRVEVLEPARLQTDLIAQAEQILRRYRET